MALPLMKYNVHRPTQTLRMSNKNNSDSALFLILLLKSMKIERKIGLFCW